MVKLIPIILAVLGAAVGLPEELRDVAGWAGGTGILSTVVLGFVSYLRAHVWKSLDGVAVTFFAMAVGAVIAVALGVATVLAGGFSDWIAYGVTAGFGASMLVDGGRAATATVKKPA